MKNNKVTDTSLSSKITDVILIGSKQNLDLIGYSVLLELNLIFKYEKIVRNALEETLFS